MIEIVKEVDLAETLERMENTEKLCVGAFVLAFVAIVLCACLVYFVIQWDNANMKRIKALEEKWQAEHDTRVRHDREFYFFMEDSKRKK